MTDPSEVFPRPLSETELLWVAGGMNKSELIAAVCDNDYDDNEEQAN